MKKPIMTNGWFCGCDCTIAGMAIGVVYASLSDELKYNVKSWVK